MLLLVWTNSSVCSDNAKSRLALKKFKGITKASTCVTSKHNTDPSKTRNTMENFLF